MSIIGGNNCRESTARSFVVKWGIFNNLGQHTTLHDNPANGKGATHPLTPMQAHTNSLAEAFIDWTTRQREDTKIEGGGGDLPKPFSGQTQQASYNKVRIRYPASPSLGIAVPSLFSMTSCFWQGEITLQLQVGCLTARRLALCNLPRPGFPKLVSARLWWETAESAEGHAGAQTTAWFVSLTCKLEPQMCIKGNETERVIKIDGNHCICTHHWRVALYNSSQDAKQDHIKTVLKKIDLNCIGGN